MFGQGAPKARRSTTLKEFSYPSDGFAVKFPYAPEPHTDSVHSDFKVWTIHLNHQAAISIRLKVDSEPCDAALEKLKEITQENNINLRVSTVSGRPAWEEEAWRRGDTMLLERYVCGIGRYYVLTFAWPVDESRPQLGMDVMDSFRLLK